ncbi:hypothetical protein [Streptomyces sp. NPDC046161]|uniref:hypothetical protein n=1 Tax=Streptomyces sp. NPDC046161 TaxID=3155132 RepID=UPI0033ECD1C8
MKKQEMIRWAAVGVLIALALIAPVLGDSTTAVVMPLLLAVVLGSINVTLRKRGTPRNVE